MSDHPALRIRMAVRGVLMAVVLLTGLLPVPAMALASATWVDFASRFVTPDGRVTDDGNGDISHSEGQGYGMLLAVAAGDRVTFQRLWNWTQGNLLVRPDGLAAWKWVPNTSGGAVADQNNATDGDVLIAWALLRAADRWPDARDMLRPAALRLIAAIRSGVVVQLDGGPVLLPGHSGFVHPEGTVVNPAYWVFPAFDAFERQEGDGFWARLSRSGLALLSRARFGKHGLPPDWVMIGPDGRLGKPPGGTLRFGYDAVRVPLYLAWARYGDPYYLDPYGSLLRAYPPGQVPATIDLPNGPAATYPASPGMQAIFALTLRRPGDTPPTGATTAVAAREDYYSIVLRLLATVAEEDSGRPP